VILGFAFPSTPDAAVNLSALTYTTRTHSEELGASCNTVEAEFANSEVFCTPQPIWRVPKPTGSLREVLVLALRLSDDLYFLVIKKKDLYLLHTHSKNCPSIP